MDEATTEAISAGIRRIAAYPRRRFRVVPGRRDWEYGYHAARCLHAAAAQTILDLELSPLLREQYLRRMMQPLSPEASLLGEDHGAQVAAVQVSRLARGALACLGFEQRPIPARRIPEEMEEEVFCADEERFEPLAAIN
jgi:hypothetical protein